MLHTSGLGSVGEAAEKDESGEDRYEQLCPFFVFRSAMGRDTYAEGWSRAQGRFVDQPDEAVHEADRLVTALMSERVYPTTTGKRPVG